MNSTCMTALALAALFALLPGATVRAQDAAAGDPPTAARLEALQGSWEGVLVGDDESDRRRITITGQSLRFERPKAGEWYEATFQLPAGTEPPQFRATITGSARSGEIGTVVVAIYRIADGTLTLVGSQVGDPVPPDTFGDMAGFGTGDGALRAVGLETATPNAARGAWDDPDTFRFDFKKVCA